MKKFRYLALLAAAAFALSGCNAIRINPERDAAQIVAEVDGEKITKKQVYDAAGLSWDTTSDLTTAEMKSQKTSALDGLIADIVTKKKTQELGYYTFTADEQKEIDDALASYRESNYENLLKDYQEKAKTDSTINAEEKANADIEDYKRRLIDSKAQEKAYEAATKDVTPTDAEVQEMYDGLLASEKQAFDSNPSQISIYEMYYGYPILYYPAEGYVRVKHILVKLPDDVQTVISDLRKAKKDDEADKKRDEELKKIETKASEALAKTKAAGNDLEKLNALITEYSEDTGMTAESTGYLVFKDSQDWVQEFTDAAMKLTDTGKPSELVATDYGYHILWLTEKLAKGDVPLDQAKDKILELAKSSKQSDIWNTTVEGWVKEYESKIKKYENRLLNP